MAILTSSPNSNDPSGKEESSLNSLEMTVEPDSRATRSRALKEELGKKKKPIIEANRESQEYRVGRLEGKLEYQKKHKSVIDKASKDSAEASLLIGRLQSAQKEFQALQEGQLALNRSSQHLSDRLQEGLKTVDHIQLQAQENQQLLDQLVACSETTLSSQTQAREVLAECSEIKKQGLLTIAQIEAMASHIDGVSEEAEQLYQELKHVSAKSTQQTEHHQMLLEKVEATYRDIQVTKEDLHNNSRQIRTDIDGFKTVSEERINQLIDSVIAEREKIDSLGQSIISQRDELRAHFQESNNVRHNINGLKRASHEQLVATNKAIDRVNEELQKSIECRESIDQAREQIGKIEGQIENRFNESLTNWQMQYDQWQIKLEDQLQHHDAQLNEKSEQFASYQHKIDEKLSDFTDEKLKVEKLSQTSHRYLEIAHKQQQKLHTQFQEIEWQKAQAQELKDEITGIKSTVEAQVQATQSILAQVELGLDKNRSDQVLIEQIIEQAKVLDSELKQQLNQYSTEWQVQSVKRTEDQEQRFIEQSSHLSELKDKINEQLALLQQQVGASTAQVSQLQQEVDRSIAESQASVALNKQLDSQVSQSLAQVDERVATLQSLNEEIQEALHLVKVEVDKSITTQGKLESIEASAQKAFEDSDKNKNYIMSALKQARLTAVKANQLNDTSANLLEQVKQTEELNSAFRDTLRDEVRIALEKTESIQLAAEVEGQIAKERVTALLESFAEKEKAIQETSDRFIALETKINQAVVDQRDQQALSDIKQAIQAKEMGSLKDQVHSQQTQIAHELTNLCQQSALVNDQLAKVDEAVRLTTEATASASTRVDEIIDDVKQLKTSFEEARTLTLGNLSKTKALHEECQQLNNTSVQIQQDVGIAAQQSQATINQVKVDAERIFGAAQELHAIVQENKVALSKSLDEIQRVRDEAARLVADNQLTIEQTKKINESSINALNRANAAEGRIAEIETTVSNLLEQVKEVQHQSTLDQTTVNELVAQTHEAINTVKELSQFVVAQKQTHQLLVEEGERKVIECQAHTTLARDYAERCQLSQATSGDLAAQVTAVKDETQQIKQQVFIKADDLNRHYEHSQQLAQDNKSLAQRLSDLIAQQQEQAQTQINEQKTLVQEYTQKLNASGALNESLENALKQAQTINNAHEEVRQEFVQQLLHAKQQNEEVGNTLQNSLSQHQAFQHSLENAQQRNQQLQETIANYEQGLVQAKADNEHSNKTNKALHQKLRESEQLNQSILMQMEQFKQQNLDILKQLAEAQARNAEAKVINKESQLANKEYRLVLRELRSDMNDLRQQTQLAMRVSGGVIPSFPANATSHSSVLAPDGSVAAEAGADTHQRIIMLEQELQRLKSSRMDLSDAAETGVLKVDAGEVEASELDGSVPAELALDKLEATDPDVDIDIEIDRELVFEQLNSLADEKEFSQRKPVTNLKSFMLSTLIAVSASGLVAYTGSDTLSDMDNRVSMERSGPVAELLAEKASFDLQLREQDLQQLQILLSRASESQAVNRFGNVNVDTNNVSAENVSAENASTENIVANDVEQQSSFRWPLKVDALDTTITQQRTRAGVLLYAAKGDPVMAINDGTVVYSGAGIRGLGNLIIVQHGEKLLSVYGNNQLNNVAEGDVVAKGQVIAAVGEAGHDGSGLYFEIRYQGEVEDPYLYFSGADLSQG